MTTDPRIKLLESEVHFSPLHAHAYVEFEGHCGFCGCDLIATPEQYALGTIDHLLPRSKYPDFEDHRDNHVLACLGCNGLKSGYCPLKSGEDPAEALEQRKEILIKRTREYLATARPRVDGEWCRARDILRGEESSAPRH
jgi:hypothetical protein